MLSPVYPSNAPVNILLSDVSCSALEVIPLNYMTVMYYFKAEDVELLPSPAQTQWFHHPGKPCTVQSGWTECGAWRDLPGGRVMCAAAGRTTRGREGSKRGRKKRREEKREKKERRRKKKRKRRMRNGGT